MSGRWEDGKTRCAWANPKNPAYIAYHDHEWGVPTHDDRDLLEMLILECFQAGLSWECVLNKREAFRRAFDNFDLEAVCAYDQKKIAALLQDEDIIRNRLKIHAAVNNARIFRDVQREFGSFDRYLWGWTDGATVYESGLASSPLSDTVSKDLKERGMKFVGPTVIYSYLQSVGIIYSHDAGCFLCRPSEAETTRNDSTHKRLSS